MSKQRVIFSLLFLFICYDETVIADSSCGDWEPYKEEKCFKIFDKAGLQSYEDAEKTCYQQENGSSLITIHFLEEQQFVSNLFKTHKIANDIWIGAKYSNSKYKWEDDSDLVFINWEQGSPKYRTDHCVQINSAETSSGKWSDVPCNKMNLVVCQKMQTWSLSHLQKILLNSIKNPFPIGFIYVQLPNEKSPMNIWPWMTWKDITSAYAGLFFRAEGGGSAAFETEQSENSPRLIEVISEDSHRSDDGYKRIDVNANGHWSYGIDSGVHPGNSWITMNFKVSSGEVRPRNKAIRIWKRTG